MLFSYRNAAVRSLTAALFCLIAGPLTAAERVAQYVIQISVDGGGSFYVQGLINAGQLPNFKRFQTEGAWTHNARTDFDQTVTLPNHTCMITGRPVMDKKFSDRAVPGHLYLNNGDPAPGETLHSTAKSYVKSVFDMAHDNGLSTGLYASKSKFSLYGNSYDESNGAPDTSGDDNGRDKVDVAVVDDNTLAMTCQFVLDMTKKPLNYTFVHFRDADSSGHASKWGSAPYIDSLKAVDNYLGLIFQLVTTHPQMKDKTAIILSADHGGFDTGHFVNTDPLTYTIPFYTWGVGVAKAADLYELNKSTRKEPGTSRPDYNAEGLQPIRNGDGGNLALRLLGVGAIPDSLINSAQDLAVDKAK
jgi:predicted AlkP superfamily pyrophosphatase or phosphodiesterase